MKNINLLSLAFIITAIMLSLLSCEKDKEMTNNNTNNEKIYMSGGDRTETKILNFIERMDLVRDNPEYEGSDEWNYSQDSAIWYVEACLNYELSCNYNRDISEEVYFTTQFDSTNNNFTGGIKDEYNISELIITHDNIFNNIESLFEVFDAENKIFIYTDLYLGDEPKVWSRYSFGSITEGYSIGSWIWGWSLGRCDGTNPGIDAADILEFYINSANNNINLNIWSPKSYYSGITTTNYIYPFTEPANNNPYGNYKLFHDYQEVNLNHHCLNTPEMNTYLNYLYDISYKYLPANKETLIFEVKDDFAAGITNNKDFWDMVHKTKITYGIHNTTLNTNNYTY